MRIEWNGDVARGIIRQMQEIERVLNDCMQRANDIRASLDEANPDGDSRRMNAIINRYEMTVSKLRHTANEAEELVDAAKRAAVCFEEAENQVRRLMDNAAEAHAAPAEGTKQIAGSFVDMQDITDFTEVTYVDWQPPEVEVIVMPQMRCVTAFTVLHTWLNDLLDN